VIAEAAVSCAEPQVRKLTDSLKILVGLRRIVKMRTKKKCIAFRELAKNVDLSRGRGYLPSGAEARHFLLNSWHG
jgi:hypothetical protein